MILDRHRQKGGAPLLGASAPGEMGPFGPYGDDSGDEHDEPADQTEEAAYFAK
jgi:hypothetical protein